MTRTASRSILFYLAIVTAGCLESGQSFRLSLSEPGGPCFSGQACDSGLVCTDGVCLDEGDNPPCAAVDCGAGFCAVSSMGAAGCICNAGHQAEGLACVVPPPCQSVTCSGHGSCRIVESIPSCVCDPNYIGVGLECLLVQNIALNKTASQSSTYAQAADVAVDGTIYSANNHNQTNSEAQPWWQVDLTGIAMIHRIDIYNRTSDPSYGDRLANFHVFVSDVEFISTDISLTSEQSDVFDFFVSGEAGLPTSIDVNRTGRYVRVQLTGTNHLHMSEVEVYGVMLSGP